MRSTGPGDGPRYTATRCWRQPAAGFQPPAGDSHAPGCSPFPAAFQCASQPTGGILFMKAAPIASLLGILAMPALSLAANPSPQPGPCDRTCLEGFVDRYLEAMQDNIVSDTLFARDVKFTENGIRLPLGGEGLWFNMSGKGNYRF